VSAAKGRMSRAIGVPLTRSGRQRKPGRLAESAFGAIVGIGFLSLIGSSLGHCKTPASNTPEPVQFPPQQTQVPSSLPSALVIDELKELQTLLNTLGLMRGQQMVSRVHKPKQQSGGMKLQEHSRRSGSLTGKCSSVCAKKC
jgi:hypothetical protein